MKSEKLSDANLIELAQNQKRKIIHIDMDCFYAAVEMRDNPSLKNLPIAVGGKPGTRGVLCTSNYEARKYGVKSAMSSTYAMKLCPKLKIIHPNFEKYKEASNIIREVFEEYTDIIEPLSLDEAFLDVTNSECHKGSATLIAKEIKEKIFERTKLTASGGVSPNKFLSKVASDINKPNGLFVIKPNDIEKFILTLPVKKIPGCGVKMTEKLNSFNIYTCGDVQKKGGDFFQDYFGSFGEQLYELSFGYDEREVVTEWVRKSFSLEHTYEKDLLNFNEVKGKLPELKNEILIRFKKFKESKERSGSISKVFIKIKFNNFKSITVERSKNSHFFKSIWNDYKWNQDLENLVDELLLEGYQKYSLPVRLVGLGFKLSENDFSNNDGGEQLIFKM